SRSSRAWESRIACPRGRRWHWRSSKSCERRLEMSTPTPSLLFVDDEPRLLEGIALHLGRRYRLVTATSAEEGLVAIRERGPFAVVVSDMRMPGMDGARFLAEVRDLAPDST